MIVNREKRIQFNPFPGVQEYKLFRADGLGKPFVEDTSGTFNGYRWTSPLAATDALGFYRLQLTPISPEALLASTVLNRLAYGPTPDELERVKSIGPQAYINEQLAPELISVGNASVVPTEWEYVTATIKGSDRSWVYIYLMSEGEGYIDDLTLVAGKTAGVGPNLLRNGDFEAPLRTNDWSAAANHRLSAITTEVKHSGNSSLKVVATSPGESDESALLQVVTPELVENQDYTISYWYLHSTNKPATVTVRLSRRDVNISSKSLPTFARLAYGTASIADLRSWYVSHAVQSKRQLLEVLTQFYDNHFTTYYEKTREYLGGRVNVAVDFEYRELKKWRDVLMNPNGTFYDLLKISVESPTMVIYLDTVTSTRTAANENYARELMELFTMGVDNGYDQKDIEEMSRAWTGWRVDKLPLGQENNPFASAVANKDTSPGYWTLRFSASNHDTTAKTMFAGKTIDVRFGAPHAGKSYELRLPARSGNAGMQDGYDIINHLANLPYTQEYLSVKLCRLFINERFMHAAYDYTDPNLTEEGKLVRDCMKTWDTPADDGRKGNLRNVLRVIFNSKLFREHGAAQQKVKNPFEFTVSTVRALRAARPNGGFTADSTGADLLAPMDRMGMDLFYREEPDGWSEYGDDWINTSAMVERMRFVQGFLKVNSAVSDPVGLLKMKLPSSQWRDAGAVVDYFFSILFPGEGKANLGLDRTAAITYLNTSDTGTAPSLFSSLDPNATSASSPYQSRVRSMVAMLMCLPRFEEQ